MNLTIKLKLLPSQEYLPTLHKRVAQSMLEGPVSFHSTLRVSKILMKSSALGVDLMNQSIPLGEYHYILM